MKLTVTFEPGGTQVITDFGPPSDKHAYAASEPGAELVSAEAVVQTEDGKKKVDWFNLSHTCSAGNGGNGDGDGDEGGEDADKPAPKPEPVPGDLGVTG